MQKPGGHGRYGQGSEAKLGKAGHYDPVRQGLHGSNGPSGLGHIARGDLTAPVESSHYKKVQAL